MWEPPPARRAGIGSALLEDAYALAVDRRIRIARALVQGDNRSMLCRAARTATSS